MIPVNEPVYLGREKELLAECIESGWVSSEGPFVKKFENDFSSFIGVEHGISVTNGTAALETAIYASEIGEGDEVIMPSFTIISCAVATINLGAKPVFVDVDSDTYCLDINQIEECITKNTKAIMVVHMYGHPVEMDSVISIAKKYDLLIIEDASQVHGAEYKGHRCGSIGDIATFSFYANKIINTGEGGMVVTNNSKMASRAKSYRNLCFKKEKRFYHTQLGNNFRMTNLQAAVGVAQLEQIDKYIQLKDQMGATYNEFLIDLPNIIIQKTKSWARRVYWMYCIEIDEKVNLTAKTMIKCLAKNGIGARPFFYGLHQQPILINKGYFDKSFSLPVTERISKQGLYLPSSVSLTKEQIKIVSDNVAKIIDRY